MAHALSLHCVDSLPRTPASEVKKLGWRGVMRAVDRDGPVLVTNHNQPEAVILTPEAYRALLQAAHSAQTPQTDALAALRQRFDQRLHALAGDDAGDRLRAVLQGPAALAGHVKAGESH